MRFSPLARSAQAQDVREAGHRALMEEGGRREVLMLVPVVFLMLPVTILFAVFYGLALIASNVATYSFLGSVYALVYLDARMRREGFDVDLAAYAEARHAATAGAG